MRKINVLTYALAVLALSACNVIEDIATIKIDVPDFTIDIPAIVAPPEPEPDDEEGSTQTENELTSFSGSYTLSITELQFDELYDYKNLITDIKIERDTLTITQDDLAAGIFKNISLKATDVNVNDCYISGYTFGKPYSSSGLTNFLKSTMFWLRNDSVTISISGETNAPPGPLTVTITVEGMQVWVKTR
jgi:hypothetical protein